MQEQIIIVLEIHTSPVKIGASMFFQLVLINSLSVINQTLLSTHILWTTFYFGSFVFEACFLIQKELIKFAILKLKKNRFFEISKKDKTKISFLPFSDQLCM